MVEKLKDSYEELRKKNSRSYVLTYKPEECYNGYTLYSNYRGNIFYLMNMEGYVVHIWNVKMAKIGELQENGNLVYAHMWHGMAQVDWYSQELWYYPCTQHHDFAIMPNGHVMILCGGMAYRAEKRRNKSIYSEGEYIPAYFIEVNPKTNEVVWRWEADEHIEELKKVGVKFPRTISDVYHSNTCEVLPDTRLGRKDSRFKEGNVVFSHRNLNVVGVIDKESGEIVWAWGVNVLDYQHMPTLIPDTHPITNEPMPGAGHFLIFDNGPHRGYSRVLELDPLTEEIVWEYTAPNFFGSWGAGADRLPNGNTLISEGGNRGRLLEVTAEGKTVWEYLTPYFGINHSIYRCVRYPPEYVNQIISNPPPRSPKKR